MDHRPYENLGQRLLVALRYRSEHVETSVGRVHLWSSDGGGLLPSLVLFHGFGSSGISWMPLVWLLRPHVRSILAIDLPGHGFSHKPEVLTLEALTRGLVEALDQRQEEPALLVGNSLGGAAAIRYANARPDRVLGASLFSPAGAPMTPEDLEELRGKFRVDRHGDAVRFVRRLAARPLGVEAHLMAPLLRRMLGDPVLRRWLDSVTPDQCLSPGEVSGLRIPIEVVWGKQERVLPDSGRAFWRANLPPDGVLLEPDGFGHSPFLDDRRWVASAILGFAARCAIDGG